ncbi:PilZ domain-containing protein [Magnetofaba australis]|nr:PilZ domain-containing protein [Magnetofaba australis]
MDQSEQSLQALKPFFKQYVKIFVRHFFHQLKMLRGESSVNKEMAPAVGYLYYRHFYPGMELKRLPDLTPNLEQAYQKFMRDSTLISLVLKEMQKDLEAFQQRNVQRRRHAFQLFLETALTHAGASADESEALVDTFKHQGDAEASGISAEEEAQAVRDERSIIERLVDMQSAKAELLLFNMYQDVPISYEATILDVTPDANKARLKIHRFQSVIVADDRFTYIKHPDLPEPVRAELVTLNREKHEAIFTDFQFAVLGMDERTHIRVRPPKPTPVTLTTTSGRLVTDLLDVSVNGLGVMVDKKSTPLENGQSVDVSLSLEQGQKLSLNGMVVAVKPQDNGGHFLGVALTPDTNAEVFISQYVYQRQAEVVRKLQQKAMSLV